MLMLQGATQLLAPCQAEVLSVPPLSVRDLVLPGSLAASICGWLLVLPQLPLAQTS